MNKWLITAIIVIVFLILIGIAYDQGLFDSLDDSTIGMLIAGLAAPYLALKNWLVGDKFQKQFKEKYNKMRADEQVHRMDYDQQILIKEKRISDLNREIELLDSKLEVLELKKNQVEKSVKNMTIEKTRTETKDLFGE